MKPLTIEELKALKEDEWLWLVYLPTNCDSYVYIKEQGVDSICILDMGYVFAYKYSEYGTKWLAYKNKEFAEEDKKDKVIELLEKLTEGAVDCISSNDFKDTEQFFNTCIRIRDMADEVIAEFKNNNRGN